LPEPVPVLTGIPALTGYGYGYGESPIFLIGYGDGDGDEYIPAIIPVPAIFLSSFKLLKYSQLIK